MQRANLRTIETGYRRSDERGFLNSLLVLEAVSIAIAEPRLNLQRGKWGETKKYFQWWEREEGEDDEESDT